MITIYGKDDCPQCEKAKHIAELRNEEYTYLKLGKDFTKEELFELFPSARSFPQIMVDEDPVGGLHGLVDRLNG
jgi:glutaredoxin 3